jgi:ABC-type oligopeptide transport system ATPase subunit
LKSSKNELHKIRRDVQAIFQDPFGSLNPRFTVSSIIEEPLLVHHIGTKADRIARVVDLLEMVGLDPIFRNRYPHEFSGGQRQRIGIARALALQPQIIIADEPVSSLDVSVQAQIINLLQDLQEKLQLTFLFIAHDLAVVQHFCDRIAVMYRGKIVEMASSLDLFREPLHPYTKTLLASIPVPAPDLRKKRQYQDANFANQQNSEESELREVSPNHWVASFRDSR